MHWSRFAEKQPDLAVLGQQRLGQQRLGGPGVVLVGTVRGDGTARISPVEPLFWQDDLWLSMLWGSRKAADLRRDPRVLVHSIVVSRPRNRTNELHIAGIIKSNILLKNAEHIRRRLNRGDLA